MSKSFEKLLRRATGKKELEVISVEVSRFYGTLSAFVKTNYGLYMLEKERKEYKLVSKLK